MHEHRLFSEKLVPPMSEIKECDRLVEAELVLGMISRNCGGNGICKLFPKRTIGREKAYTHYAEVCFRLDAQENLHLIFDKKSMRAQTIRKHFSNGFFRIGESVKLAPFICEALGKVQIIIDQGIYQVIPVYRYLLLTISAQEFYSIDQEEKITNNIIK